MVIGGGGAPAPAPTTPEPAPTPTTPPVEEPVTPVTFTDTTGSVHSDAICKVAAAGITSGYSDGTFRPEVSVSRGQMATFLSRGLEL